MNREDLYLPSKITKVSFDGSVKVLNDEEAVEFIGQLLLLIQERTTALRGSVEKGELK